MMAEKKSRGLGRGLGALFEDEENNFTPPALDGETQAEQPRGGRITLSLDLLQPGKFQPRNDFEDESITALSESIKQHGLIQPILVRALEGGKKYEIIAGERRWRAAQKAQLHEVPVIISTFNDNEALEVALVENLQREDLNAIDEALGYQRLMKEFDRTQEDVAKALGKSRSHIANTIRLLQLPPNAVRYLREGKLTAGHARTLVTLNNAEQLADEIVKRNLNVRQAEALAAEKGGTLTRKLAKVRVDKDADTIALENDMSNLLGMRLAIESKDGTAGTVKIEFKSLDQLDELIHRLSKFPVIKLTD